MESEEKNCEIAPLKNFFVTKILFKYPQALRIKGCSTYCLINRKTISYEYSIMFKNAETLYLSTFQQKIKFKIIWKDVVSIYIC